MSVDAMLAFWGDEAMSVCASMIRGLIVAAPGRKLVIADYSNIEGRYLAWLAGEEWKLDAYRAKDAGTGEDIYKLQVMRALNLPIEQIDSFLRQQGKGMDLSMGYEGGVGAFINVANAYKLDLVELGKSAPRTMSPEFMERGRSSWKWAVDNDETEGLPEDIYVACAALKHAYRDANSKIAAFWEELLDCARLAVRSVTDTRRTTLIARQDERAAHPDIRQAPTFPHAGQTYYVAEGKIAMKADSSWLAVQIPSGRKIMFAKPRIETRAIVDKKTKKPKLDSNGDPVLRTQLTALKSPGWMREGIYGGLLANAVTQGGCRDILVGALLDLDAEGWPIIMHVHDDVVCELDDADSRDHDAMIEIMLRQGKKYPGLPLAADGFTTKRLRKG